MNDTDKKARTVEKWKVFREGDSRKRKKLTNHTFAFCIDDVGSGWEYIHFELDGENVCSCRVSYIGSDVHAFVRTVTELKEKDFLEFAFLDEPGEYDFVFSRRGDAVYIELPQMEDGFFLKYDYFVERILEGFHQTYRS